jgi:PhnB protein
MTGKPKPIPDGYHTVTPSLVVKDVPAAIDFYKKAFGAKELSRFKAPDGRTIHGEIQVGDTRIMLGPACTEGRCLPPTELEGTTCSLYLYVPDADAAYDKAVSAGAEGAMAMADMFWGDRMGQVTDPFGHRWSLATHKEDLSESEMRERAEEFFASMAGAH